MTRNHFGVIGSFLILVMFGIALYLFWAYVAAISIGFILLVLIVSVVAGVRWHKVTGLPLAEANREALRLAHEQQMERERLRILNERHVFDMRLQWEKHELDKHLALTRIPADAKGHYPYIVHPEQGYQALPNVNMRAIAQRSTVSEDEVADEAAQSITALIEYSAVKPSIPQGHALVGISARGIETREDSVRALVWVVGSSGVGKTNTVSLRVDDDYEKGHRFLGVDPPCVQSR
jgi:hypothetical protein